MWKSKHYQYFLFDDTKLLLYGIPIVALLAPLLFLTVSLEVYIEKLPQIFIESIIYTVIICFALRKILIVLRRKFPDIEQTFQRVLWQFSAAVVFTFIICKTIGFTEKLFYQFCGLQDPFVPDFPVAFLAIAFVTLSIMVLYEAIYFFNKFQKALEEKEELRVAHVQTQLDNLRNQINPHFLFNSLNTLMNLIPNQQDRAMNYLDKLSKFYRYSVGKKENTTVPVKQELENAIIYADLLKERFGKNISFDIKNGVSEAVKILPMTLQLLIENAVKHNVVSKSKPLHIDIFTSDTGDYITVKNNLQPKIQAVASTGMGLNNIKERFTYFTDKQMTCKQGEEFFEVNVPLI
jgi:hypothetical protein